MPKSERLFDILYFSIQLVDFFSDFFSESLHFISCQYRGQNRQDFWFFLVVLPLFFGGQGVPI